MVGSLKSSQNSIFGGQIVLSRVVVTGKRERKTQLGEHKRVVVPNVMVAKR